MLRQLSGRLAVQSRLRQSERAAARNSSGTAIGIAGREHIRNRDAATDGQPAALANLRAGPRPKFRLPPTTARLEPVVAQSRGKHRSHGRPAGGIPAPRGGEVVAREHHGCPAPRARMSDPVPRLLAAAAARHAHVVDLVGGLGVPAHTVRITAQPCKVSSAAGPTGDTAPTTLCQATRTIGGRSGCRAGRRNGDVTDCSESSPDVFRWCGSGFFVAGSDGFRVIE